MDKKVNALVEAYEKHIGKEAKIYETPGKPHEYLSKSEEDEPVDIDQYRSFVGQLMFFTTDAPHRASRAAYLPLRQNVGAPGTLPGALLHVNKCLNEILKYVKI